MNFHPLKSGRCQLPRRGKKDNTLETNVQNVLVVLFAKCQLGTRRATPKCHRVTSPGAAPATVTKIAQPDVRHFCHTPLSYSRRESVHFTVIALPSRITFTVTSSPGFLLLSA